MKSLMTQLGWIANMLEVACVSDTTNINSSKGWIIKGCFIAQNREGKPVRGNKRGLRQASWFVSVPITINGWWLPAVRTNTLSIKAHFSQIYFAGGVTDGHWSWEPKSLRFRRSPRAWPPPQARGARSRCGIPTPSHPQPPPALVLSHYPHRCRGKWLARGLQTQVPPALYACQEKHKPSPPNTWETFPQVGLMMILKWRENCSLAVTLPHSDTRGKMSTSAKKALKQKWWGKCDTTWWALCIHIAFCS